MKSAKTKNRIVKNILAAILLPLLIISFESEIVSGQTTNERLLKSRITKYYRSFAKEQYSLMWDMSSENLKIKNGNDKNSYIDSMQKLKKENIRWDIRRLSITDTKASVTMQICVKFPKEKDWKCETIDDNWVFEQGNWYFDLVTNQ